MRKKGTSPFLSAVILAVVALGVALPVYHFLSLETVRQGLAYPLVLSYFTVDYTEGSQLVLVGLKNMGNAEIYNASPLFLASSSSLAASPYSASVELLSGGSASALNAIQASCSPSSADLLPGEEQDFMCTLPLGVEFVATAFGTVDGTTVYAEFAEAPASSGFSSSGGQETLTVAAEHAAVLVYVSGVFLGPVTPHTQRSFSVPVGSVVVLSSAETTEWSFSGGISGKEEGQAVEFSMPQAPLTVVASFDK